MGFFSSITKPFKKAFKGIKKVVKKVGKSIAKVAKKVVKGVGKALGKLGPLASMALMFIPGMQAFATGLWSSMGVTGAVAQKALTSAAISFLGSGGDLKAAVVGGALGGFGAAAGGTYSGMKEGLSFGDALGKTMAEQGTITSWAEGVAAGKAQWGNFTNSMEEMFSASSSTGDVADGASKVFEGAEPIKYGESGTATTQAYGAEPMDASSIATPEESLFKPSEIQPPKTDVERIAELTGISPEGQQAQMLAEQQFGDVPELSFAGDSQASDWLAQSAAGGTPTYMAAPDTGSKTDKAKSLAESLLSPSAASTYQVPAIQDPGAEVRLGSAGRAGATGGLLGLSAETIASLPQAFVEMLKQQEQFGMTRAAKGWSVA